MYNLLLQLFGVKLMSTALANGVSSRISLALLWKAFDNFPYHSPRCFDLLVLDWIGTSLLFCLAFGWASAGTFASTCTEGPSNFVSSLLLAWTSSVPARLAWAWKEQRVVSSEEAFDELSGQARYLCAEHKLDRHKQEGILASSFER